MQLFLNGQPIAGYESIDSQPLAKSRGGKLLAEVRCQASEGTRVQVRVESMETWIDIQAQ